MARGHFYPLPPPFIGGRQPYAPQLGIPQSGPLPSAPPPMARSNLDIIVRAHRDQTWTLIYVASIAPILATPETVDSPPPRSFVTLNSIVRQWQPPPHRPPELEGIAAFAPAPIAPDNPPRRSYVNQNVIARQAILPVWWPLPKINLAAPPSGIDPPATGMAKYLLLLGVG